LVVVVVADEQVQQTYFCLEEPVNCFAEEHHGPKKTAEPPIPTVEQPLVKDIKHCQRAELVKACTLYIGVTV